MHSPPDPDQVSVVGDRCFYRDCCRDRLPRSREGVIVVNLHRVFADDTLIDSAATLGPPTHLDNNAIRLPSINLPADLSLYLVGDFDSALADLDVDPGVATTSGATSTVNFDVVAGALGPSRSNSTIHSTRLESS